jgi:hypothetical protein
MTDSFHGDLRECRAGELGGFTHIDNLSGENLPRKGKKFFFNTIIT